MPAGGSAKVELTGEFYVGLGVSAHNTGRIETASFSNVTLGEQPLVTGPRRRSSTRSRPSASARRTAGSCTWSRRPGRIEAPNWFPDDTNTLYFNSGGKLYKVQAEPPGTTRESRPPGAYPSRWTSAC